MRRRACLLLAAVAVVGFGADPAAGRQEGPATAGVPVVLTAAQEKRFERLESRLKCPVCRTQSVRESSSFMALEMRARIGELIAAGRTDDEILAYFVERYGDYILLEPRKEGFGLSAYVLPLLAVIVGGALLLVTIVRRRREPDPAAGEGSEPSEARSARALSPAERARVDEELKRYTA